MFENYGWTEEIVVIDDKKIGSHREREREREREILKEKERDIYRKRERERDRKRERRSIHAIIKSIWTFILASST